LDELWNQTLAIFNQKSVEEEEFEHQIAFNCIPQVDVLNESGSSREEERMVEETRFLLEQPSLPIIATAIRVPVLHGYAQAVHLVLKEPLLPERCIELLSSQPDIQVYPHGNDYPMPLTVVGTDEVHGGRIRVDPADSRRMSLWIVSDNVRRGVALNALRSAELLAESFAH
jgi:aspartate-semialdehyde dehydrogenase